MTAKTTAPRTTGARSRTARPAPVEPAPDGLTALAEHDAVTATWCFDAGDGPEPYPATIRFSGERVDLDRSAGPRDRFVRYEQVDEVLPGTGLVSVSTQVDGINAGRWSVNATIVTPGRSARPGRSGPGGRRAHGQNEKPSPATWSWRHWRVTRAPVEPLKSRWAPLAPFTPRPAVLPGSWAGLVVLGVVVGLILQRAVLIREHLPANRALVVSLLAVAGGMITAKVWYLLEGRGQVREPIVGAGWCIQGFVVGLTAAFALLLPLASIPAAQFFDATAPALLIGMAVGRLGCFFTGCCAGRPTRSHWGVFCSDRRVGMRRVPVQLLESATAAITGLVALAAAASDVMPVHGAVFVGSFAAYTLVRQFLLRLRAEPRKSTLTWRLTVIMSAVVLAGDLIVALVAGR